MRLSVGSQHRIRELDGWRAISVLLVISHHVFRFRFRLALVNYPSLIDIFDDAGPLGVRIFFVISGFVICRLIIAEELRYGWISLKGFYYRRFFRIIPPLYLFLATLAVLRAGNLISMDWKALIGSGLFLTNRMSESNNWFAGHTWSLAVEEQFYLVFPALWILLRKRISWRGPLFACFYLLLAGRDLLAGVSRLAGASHHQRAERLLLHLCRSADGYVGGDSAKARSTSACLDCAFARAGNSAQSIAALCDCQRMFSRLGGAGRDRARSYLQH